VLPINNASTDSLAAKEKVMQQLLEISAWPTADVAAGHDKQLGHYAEGPGVRR